MFNKLKKWYWWLTRDREVGYDFEADVALLSRPNVVVEKDMVIVSKDTKAYQQYLAYCVKHDVLDKEVRRCAKLHNKVEYRQSYERAVKYLRTNTTKEENQNDWN